MGFIPELADGGPVPPLQKRSSKMMKRSLHTIWLEGCEYICSTHRLNEVLQDARANQAGHNTSMEASKPVVQRKKRKRARNFEIPTSFETIELPSMGTDAALTSQNKIEISSSTDIVPLPSFDTFKIHETFALSSSLDTVLT
ncbi:hypothetical protein PsorP6_007862 [Peronosclerospora sorghi]|uniref:Uncharacterized protein n=1 Tax=Peronosclerospora sorghi TaxID=230839 RepID=A0ACC0W9A8_9STRA|nr:hypothetical protein PsorP6_007862 [Peronosclerospora sorghi]